jgi:hypothetical protein
MHLPMVSSVGNLLAWQIEAQSGVIARGKHSHGSLVDEALKAAIHSLK